jgi:hypothetical protein
MHGRRCEYDQVGRDAGPSDINLLVLPSKERAARDRILWHGGMHEVRLSSQKRWW